MCPPEMGKHQQMPHCTARKQQLAACGRDVRDPLLSLCTRFDLHSELNILQLSFYCFTTIFMLIWRSDFTLISLCDTSLWENALLPFPLLLRLLSSLLGFLLLAVLLLGLS